MGWEVKISQGHALLFFLKQDGCDHGHLQLSGSHFENELHHRADSKTSRTGGVDLVPNGVAVHLQTQETSLLKLESQSREDYRLELYLSTKKLFCLFLRAAYSSHYSFISISLSGRHSWSAQPGATVYRTLSIFSVDAHIRVIVCVIALGVNSYFTLNATLLMKPVSFGFSVWSKFERCNTKKDALSFHTMTHLQCTIISKHYQIITK